MLRAKQQRNGESRLLLPGGAVVSACVKVSHKNDPYLFTIDIHMEW